MKQAGFSWWVILALALTFFVVFALGVITYRNTTVLLAADRLVAQTYHVRELVEAMTSSFKDAESSQRGFMQNGDEQYAQAYERAVKNVKSKLKELRAVTPDDEVLNEQLDELDELAAERLGQLEQTITLRRQSPDDEGVSRIREQVLTARGRQLMESIRELYDDIQEHQREVLEARKEESARRAVVTHDSIIFGHMLALALLLLAGVAMRSDRRRRNEAEAQLETSQDRLSAIVDSAMDAIITIDDAQRIVLLNPSAQEIFRCDRSALGQSVERFVPERFREAVRRHIQRFAESSASHRRVGEQGQIAGLRSSGEEFPIEASVSKTTVNNQQLLTIMMRDVSEREASKRQIREQSAMLDQVRDAIHVRDMNDRVVYWNRGAERLYGWDAREAIGRRASELLSPTESETADLARTVTSDKGDWVGELAQRTKSSREILVEQRRTLIRDEIGRPGAQLIIDIDVTDRKKLEAQQRRSQRLESIGTLAGGIAHDLNNVLTPILMGAKLISRDQSPTKRQEIARTIQSAAERGADMIKQLLSFAGGSESRRELVQLVEVIQEVRGILDHTLPKSIEVRVEVPEQIPQISGDATELLQLLLNLCINARDAMPDGGRLTISAENVLVDQRAVSLNPDLIIGPHVLLTVADNGIGISHDVIDKVFDPFFTTKEQGKGTGLGLATCRGIVRNHSGSINVFSEPGHGAEFTIHLPVRTVNQPTVVPDAPRELPPGGGELILVVDDEGLVLEMTRTALETHGYRVLTATGGAEAVAVYPQYAQDVKAVIVDMMMPGMDGSATISALHQINPAARVIAASGLRTRSRDRDLLAGTRAFLSKPYSEAQLLITLRHVIDSTDDAVPASAVVADA